MGGKTRVTWASAAPTAAFGALLALLGFASGATAQDAGVRVIEDVKLDRLTPNRVELIEHTVSDSGPVVESYTYVTIDEGQNWSVPSTVIDWMPTTWNGIGQDVNVVRSSDLTLLSRVTPGFGGYAARLLESHMHRGMASVIGANPDGEPDGPADLPWGDRGGLDVRRGGARDLESNRFYNEITVPYLFASLGARAGDRYLLPEFSPYIGNGSVSYLVALVDGDLEIRGEDGSLRTAQVIRTRRIKTTEAADTVDFDRPGAEHVFYVSADAPYFLGKTWTRLTGAGDVQVFKTWRYLQHQILRVSPSYRLERMLEVRDKYIELEAQELPWDPEIGFR